MRIRFTNPLLKIINKGVIRLSTPSNLNYFWNFGSLLGLCLIIQIITGVLLSMHYNPEVNMAFSSISHILRDVNEGWKIKIIHANGASMFFILVYLHISRGIYYGSYLKKSVWNIGIILFFLMMIISFLGYVLPWGQMSFWGATVITNFISTIPYIGNELVFWIWGGFSVAQPTLNRFFSLHYLFPFILIFFILLHITYLHINGSSNPLGVRNIYDRIPFHPYYILKDLNGIIICLFIFFLFVFIYPNLLGDPENYIKANSLITPQHIMPEWYFLFAYAILRAMPNKLGGVILLVCSILILFILPFFHTSNHETLTFRPLSNFVFWLFISNFFFLTWVGSKPIMMPYIMWAMVSTHLYFIIFLFLSPNISNLENYIYIY